MAIFNSYVKLPEGNYVILTSHLIHFDTDHIYGMNILINTSDFKV